MAEVKSVSIRWFQWGLGLILFWGFVISPLRAWWTNRHDVHWLSSKADGSQYELENIVIPLVISLIIITAFELTGRYIRKGKALSQEEARSRFVGLALFPILLGSSASREMVSSSGWGWATLSYTLTAVMVLVIFLRYRRLMSGKETTAHV
jgi:uncharacterized Tic20 family protein